MWKWAVVLVLVVVLGAGAVVVSLGGAGPIGVSASGGGGVGGGKSGGGGGGSGGGGEKRGGLFSFGREPEATEVQVGEVEVGDLVRTVSAPGSIEPRTLVQVSSQVSAKILALPFREGDTVGAGEVVVRLDPQNLVAQLESARAGLLIEEARLDGAMADQINAKLERDRWRQLHETGDASQSELDTAEARYLQVSANLKAIQASILVARANIARVEKDIENTVITSPIAGTVTSLNAEVGETAIVGTTNTPGSVIMEIADRSSMLLKAQVDETNIAAVGVGQGARVYINAYEGEEYTGRVEKIGLKRQVSSTGTGFFVVEVALELGEGQTLLSGLSASTDIAVESFFDTMKIPSQAVLDRRVDELPVEIRGHPLVDRTRTFARVVFRYEGGRAEMAPVRVGSTDLTHIVIEEGLSAGDRVIVGPFKELPGLKDGKAVRDEREGLGAGPGGAVGGGGGAGGAGGGAEGERPA